MNKIYKVIWSQVANAFVAVSELTSSRGKTKSTTNEGASTKVAGKLFAFTMLGSAVVLSGQAFAATVTGADQGQACFYDTDSKSVICGDASTVLEGRYYTKSSGSVLMGLGSTGNGESMVVIGRNSKGTEQSVVAIGESAVATTGQTIAIGSNANAVGLTDIMIGKGAGFGITYVAGKERNIGIGDSAAKELKGNNVVAVGSSAAQNAQLSHAVAIGSSANINAQSLNGGVANYTVAVGRETVSVGEGSTALGAAAKAYTASAIAIGQEAKAGLEAGAPNVAADNAIAIGGYSEAGRNAVAVGRQSRAVLTGTTAVGSNSQAVGLTSTAVGFNSIAASRNSVAMGLNSVAGVADSVDANGSTISGKTYAVAIGPAAKALETTSTALGNATLADKLNSVALGSASKTDADATKEDTATVGNLTYSGFAGDEGVAAGDQVSVGAKGEERQIKNVAPGKISNTSTDAINGSQLYATNDVLGNVAKTTATHLGGGSTVGTNGSLTAPTYNVVTGSTTPAQAGNSNQNFTTTPANNVGDALTNLNTYINQGFNVQNNEGAVKGVVTPGESVKFANGNVTTATVDTEVGGVTTVKYDVKVDGTTVKVDDKGNIAAVTAPLTTNTDGKVNTPAAPNALATAGDIADAINNSGWKATSGATGSGVVDGTTEELINPSETVTFQAGDNMVLNQAGNVFTYSLNKDININSVQFNDGPKITNDGDNIKVGDKDGNATKITNVKAGEADTDAVNVSQLKAATTHYYSVNDGGTQGSNYNNDGATGGNSLAAGVGTQASGISSTAIGHNAKASSANAIAMGVNASASQRNALAMGSSASSATEDSVAIGKDVKVLDTGAPQTDQEGSVAIGSRTEVSGKGSVGIGRNVRATARNAVAIGDAALATNTQAVAIARDAQASGAGAVAMGSASRSTSSHTTALGVMANASVSRSVALGSEAVADRIGFNIAMSPVTTDANATFAANQVYANAGATQAAKNAVIATVRNTTTDTYGAVSVGNAGVTRQIINLAPGSEDSDAVNVAQLKAATTHYYSVNDNGVQRANYNNDGATGINSLAAGTAASATESAATAVGNQATAAARNSVALGNQATANTAWSVAIGNKADATGSSAVAIGNGATTTVGDSVALGAGSKADANGRAVTEATVNGLTFGDFAGSVTHPGKVVSVGAKGEERQIKNVAPGQISNTSTDAINGSQLYATNDVLGNVANTVVENFGGNAALNPDGSITYTNIGNTGKDNIHDAIQAATTKVEEADGIKVVPTTNADGSTTYTVSAKTDGTTTKIDGNGNIAAVTTTFTPSTDGKVGAPVGNGDSLVTANTVADAINNSGWKATSGATGSGVVDGTTEELINPSETVTFQAGDNMVLNQAGNVFTYSLNKDININSVQFNDGPKITNDGDNIKVGDKDGNATKITNVKAGEADTDAVNVSQLEKAQAAATTKVEEADGIKVVPTTNADGSTTYTVSAKTDGTTTKIDGNGNIAAVTTTFTPSTDGKVGAPVGNGDSLVTANTVADAINNSGWKATSGATGSGVVDGTTEELINPSETVTFQAGDNMVLNQAGNVFTYSLNKDININSVQFNDGPKITNDGDNIKVGDKDGNATKITNVKAGEADTDAVNVSQLKAVEATANKGWNLTTNGKADSKSNVKPGDTVDFANTDGNVKIENTGNKVTVNLNKDIDLTKDGSVTIGDTKVNNDGLTIVGGPSVTKSGIDAGDKKITNVADGVISATSKDAVNGSQLYQAVNNINTSIAASKEEVKSADGSVTVTTTQNAKGANVYDLSVNTDGTTIKKNADGSLAVNTTPLTNNADGTVKTPTAPNAIATAGDIANAINNSGFTLTAQGSDGSLVKPGATVDMNNTDGNIVISKSASDNKVTYNLAKNVKVDSVTAGDTVMNTNGITIKAPVEGNADNTVSLTKDGLNNGGNRITNVAPGVNGTDAVNVDQLKGVGQHINNRIDDVADDANAGVSSAMAMAVLPQAYIPGKSMLTGGIGSYNGEGAVAVGFSKLSDNGRWVMKMSGTADTEGNLGGAVGAGFHF